MVVGIVGRIGNQSFSNSRGVWGKAVGAAYREKQKASEAGIYVLRRSCSSVGEEIAERRGEERRGEERRQQRGDSRDGRFQMPSYAKKKVKGETTMWLWE